MANESRVTKQIAEVLATTTANIRVTKQIAEVLATTTANIRLTKQVIEVLGVLPTGPGEDEVLSILQQMSVPNFRHSRTNWKAVSYRN